MKRALHFPENVEAASSCRLSNIVKHVPANYANDLKGTPPPSDDSRYSRAKSFVPHLFLSLCWIAFGASVAQAGGGPVPASLPDERYAQMSAHSPFALATPAAPVQQAGPSFAANWFVSGIGRLNGQDYVTIKARDLSTQFSLYGSEEKDGVVLASIEWSEVVGKSAVILRKGSETARVVFNEAELKGTPQSSGGARQAISTASPKTAPGGVSPPTVATGAAKTAPGAANPPATPIQPRPLEIRRRQVPIPAPR